MSIRNAIKEVTEVKKKEYIPTDKRYLVGFKEIGNIVYGSIFDKQEQRFVYNIEGKNKEKIIEEINRLYGTRNIKILEEGDKFIEPIGKSSLGKHKLLCEVVKELDNVGVQITPRMKKIKDVYKFIDKYKVNLKPKFEYNEKDNILSFELYSDSVELGVHKIICDFNKGTYLYYFKGKLIENKNNLEDIFK